MVKTFEALDNEFAVATGSNVNNTPNTSTFDYPPNGTKDLIVTSNPGDTNPNLFELGETYDVSWGGNGGGNSIQNAVIIRSDSGPGGQGGIIVFEGIDSNGDVAQVVWSPGVDLEGWYWDNFSAGQSPGFWTVDQNSAYTHAVVCFAAQTRIKTAQGWMPAGRITPGMKVWTRDDGFQPVLWTGHKIVPGVGPATPVRFAPGAIGNRRALLVSQQHRILTRTPLAELYFASDEVFVPAIAMIGEPGIHLQSMASIHYVHLLLERHQIINAEGAMCESMFMGDMCDIILADEIAARSAIFDRVRDHVAARPMLTYREARKIVGTRIETCRAPMM